MEGVFDADFETLAVLEREVDPELELDLVADTEDDKDLDGDGVRVDVKLFVAVRDTVQRRQPASNSKSLSLLDSESPVSICTRNPNRNKAAFAMGE
jgi:hypothetical protein